MSSTVGIWVKRIECRTCWAVYLRKSYGKVEFVSRYGIFTHFLHALNVESKDPVCVFVKSRVVAQKRWQLHKTSQLIKISNFDIRENASLHDHQTSLNCFQNVIDQPWIPFNEHFYCQIWIHCLFFFGLAHFLL